MARVTVEDCIEKVDTRFDLILLAAHRARSILTGAPLLVDRDNDKNPVVALREIADEVISVDTLTESLISSLQRVLPEEDSGEETERMAIEHQKADAAISEADMLKALTADRDGAPDNRF